MTEILTIDPAATLSTVHRLLMPWRQQRVAVFLPDGWQAIQNTTQLRLLQRQAQRQRCELALITRNEDLQRMANSVGIPVFIKPEEALVGTWRMQPLLPLLHPRRLADGLPDEPRWQRRKIIDLESSPTYYRSRQARIRAEAIYRQPLPAWLSWLGTTLAGLLIAAMVGLFVFYVVPAATITLVPGREPIAVNVQVTANPFIDAPDLDFDQLPARLVETNIEETGSLATTGTRQKATDRAQGSVVFSNLGANPVRIPAGTIVSTGTGTAVNFRTTTSIVVPGGFNQQATASIEAMDPGIQGNVRANTINTIGGGYNLRVRVSNPGGTGGGGSQLTAVVTQADRDQLLAELLARAEARAAESLQGFVTTGEWLAPESVQSFITSQAFSAFNDEEAQTLELTLRLLVRGVAVDQAVLRELLLDKAQQAIPERGKLVASTLSAQRVPGAEFSQNIVTFTMTVGAEYVIPIDPVEIRSAIAGLPPTAAITVVQQRWPLERPPEIYQDPEWFATLPALGNRIQVRVEYEPVLASR
ncbi:MAG: baseplate J/gp47 family protein [Caldilineaceae bacterium]|nr:baseplate J/gp47 family protein [Caldilineaceae bacterium]